MNQLVSSSLFLLAGTASADQCQDNFSKSGNPFKGTQYSSSVTLPNLSMKDGLGQMRGIMLAEKMVVITEDKAGGTMLVEQPATGTTRPIPTIIQVSVEGTSATVAMTVKTEKGMLSKAEDMKSYMCQLLSRLKGGKEGKLAGAKGSQSKESVAPGKKKDAFVFSMEMANEAKANVVALNARHKGRSFTLGGKIDYIQEDGDNYNVSFKIPEMRDRALSPLPGQATFRVGVACLFKSSQLANVLTLREGQNVVFTGTFYKYDDFRKMVWLENCKQESGKK